MSDPQIQPEPGPGAPEPRVIIWHDPELLFGVPRNPGWHKLERLVLVEEPLCIVCGGPADCVHHLVPFHIDKSKEMCRENLRPICNRHNCHFLVAHLCNWSRFNEHLDEDAALIRGRIKMVNGG